ncbi:hypothetical protein WJX72_004270 [[Myrmecia] bisecta]|uniref:Uncharacterized protein n=1 Tax=[Myrmecia] bisecta TaxID=41462 RepID=A0AAW1QQY7_9CHLO
MLEAGLDPSPTEVPVQSPTRNGAVDMLLDQTDHKRILRIPDPTGAAHAGSLSGRRHRLRALQLCVRYLIRVLTDRPDVRGKALDTFEAAEEEVVKAWPFEEKEFYLLLRLLRCTGRAVAQSSLRELVSHFCVVGKAMKAQALGRSVNTRFDEDYDPREVHQDSYFGLMGIVDRHHDPHIVRQLEARPAEGFGWL